MLRRALVLGLFVLANCSVGRERVDLHVRALVGGRAFACGATYANLGRSQSSGSFSDLRMYVSDVALIAATGERVPLELVHDGAFQGARTTLLDFEDKTGACSSGSRETNTQIRGSVPRGHYTGLALTLGVPFEENHQDASIAQAPFDVTSMFWVWRSGYKFLRLDGRSDDAGRVHPFAVHLGSTGCQGAAPTHRPTRCTRPNRAQVLLPGFDHARDTVDLHLDTLLAELSLHGDGAVDGCESDPDDEDCGPVFRALGLSKGGTQTFVRVGAGAR